LHADFRETEEIFQKISEFDLLDKRRLLLMNPVTIATLLNTEDLPKIAQNYHLFEDLVIVRCSVASDLMLNKNRALISLCTIMPKYKIKTFTLVHQPEEETEAQ
jgi:hypothetical protein